jgi:glutamine amidotransferase
MCELLAMSSRQATRLSFSLEALSSHSAAPGVSRDGWGVAYYQDNDVALFREPSAASDSPLVRHLESQGPRTTLAISHIRHATQGTVSLANTQPFVRECAGAMHAFAHNGNLAGIEGSVLQLADRYQPVGSTDSELAFCALLERLSRARGRSRHRPSLEERLDLIAAFAARLETVRGHHLESLACKPSAGSPILRSGRRTASRSTTNATDRSKPCCTAWCSSTPPPSSSRLRPQPAPTCRSL